MAHKHFSLNEFLCSGPDLGPAQTVRPNGAPAPPQICAPFTVFFLVLVDIFPALLSITIHLQKGIAKYWKVEEEGSKGQSPGLTFVANRASTVVNPALSVRMT